MVVRRIKIWKRREILIALRAHRHFERSRGSLLQNVHRLMWGSTRTSFFLGAYTLIRECSKDPSATLGMTRCEKAAV